MNGRTHYQLIEKFVRVVLPLVKSNPMSGRGRELTLPSWMTSENGPQMTAAAAPAVAVSVPPTIVAPSVSIPVVMPGPPQPPVFMAKPVTHLAPTLSMPMPTMPTMPSLFPMGMGPMGGMFPGVAGAATSVSDPNNDVSCWSEFVGEGGRKYWHNRVTGLGTYDKPFCLKSPEERSIPPCAWKEYTSNDKKYYSNGTESTWDMPEEFRVWKEKMDAIEAKKAAQAAAAKAAQNFGLGPSAAADKTANSTKVILPTVTYNTAAEAQEAFNQLLVDKKITSSQKIKDVIDICQFDARWNALKSQGEKKQFIAEFQTKLLKQEKEEQKVKARKNRDAFLLMLAENTDIDARTRWRDAVTILQDDVRFKNVEDVREREDLFKDFILELEKKEREDGKKQRADAIVAFHEVLEQLYRENKFNRLSIWGESRSLFTDLVVLPKFKSMTDADFRICFQDFVSTLAESHRQQERKRKEEYLSALDAKKRDFGRGLETLVTSGAVSVANSRWSTVSLLSEVTSLPSYKELIKHVDERPSDLQIPSDLTGLNECRDVFEGCMVKLQEQHKADKRAVKDLMHLMKVKISHDSKFEDLKALVSTFIGSPKSSSSAAAVGVSVSEEGEEVDDSAAVPQPAATSYSRSSSSGAHPSSSSAQSAAQTGAGGALEEHLKSLMSERPHSLLNVFNECKERAIQDHEEDLRLQQRAERKFTSLLEETFYLSDHVGLQWDEAKKTLQKRSAYDAVGKSDRKRLFGEYMAGLAAKLEAKTKSIKSLTAASSSSAAPAPSGEAVSGASAAVVGGDGVTENVGKDALVKDNRGSSQHHSESSSHNNDRSNSNSSSGKRERSYSGEEASKRGRH